MSASGGGSRNRIRSPASLLSAARRLRPRHSPTWSGEGGPEQPVTEVLQQQPVRRVDPPHLPAHAADRPHDLENEDLSGPCRRTGEQIGLRLPGRGADHPGAKPAIVGFDDDIEIEKPPHGTAPLGPRAVPPGHGDPEVRLDRGRSDERPGLGAQLHAELDADLIGRIVGGPKTGQQATGGGHNRAVASSNVLSVRSATVRRSFPRPRMACPADASSTSTRTLPPCSSGKSTRRFIATATPNQLPRHADLRVVPRALRVRCLLVRGAAACPDTSAANGLVRRGVGGAALRLGELMPQLG